MKKIETLFELHVVCVLIRISLYCGAFIIQQVKMVRIRLKYYFEIPAI